MILKTPEGEIKEIECDEGVFNYFLKDRGFQKIEKPKYDYESIAQTIDKQLAARTTKPNKKKK